MALPQWCTPERQGHLVELFQRSGGLCIYGQRRCPYPEHYYEVAIEGLIADWQAEDREERRARWEAERRALHALPESGRWGRRFDPVARERALLERPLYYREGESYDPLRRQRVARVRIPGTYIRLYVDVPPRPSKNARRKARRYGLRPLAQEEDIITAAVLDWKRRHRLA